MWRQVGHSQGADRNKKQSRTGRRKDTDRIQTGHTGSRQESNRPQAGREIGIRQDIDRLHTGSRHDTDRLQTFYIQEADRT
jgi:hypothetical protein